MKFLNEMKKVVMKWLVHLRMHIIYNYIVIGYIDMNL